MVLKIDAVKWSSDTNESFEFKNVCFEDLS